jgi:hypothetical protein
MNNVYLKYEFIIQSEPGSSVSVMSDYGLNDGAIGVPSPAEAKDFSSSLCVQTGSGTNPASCPTGTGGKALPGRDDDHSPPSSTEVDYASGLAFYWQRRE